MERSEKVVVDTTKEIVKECYSDVAKPALKSSGNLFSLIPRAINACLAPVEKWILHREYQVEETKKLLEIKLQNVKPEDIVAPELHIAVPAMQALSYSMDNEEIRNMFANLLASSMDAKVKNDVLPAFVEMIKQLTPDEARIMKYLYNIKKQPIITLRRQNKTNGGGYEVLKNFSNLENSIEVESPNLLQTYLDNLVRLKLIDIPFGSHIVNESLYESLENSDVVKKIKESKLEDNEMWNVNKSYLAISDIGNLFCGICLKG